MESETSKSKIWKVITLSTAVISLLAGGMIYLLFRPERLLMFDFIKYVQLWNYLEIARFTTHFLPEWVEYNLPDGLWTFSYTLCIGYVWKFDIKKCWLFILILPSIAIADECLQYFQIVPGTYDAWDIFAYLIASLLGVLFVYIVNCLIYKSIKL